MTVLRFNNLTRLRSAGVSRRQTIGGLLLGGAALAGAGFAETTAKKRKKKCKAGPSECLAQTEPCISVVTRKCDGLLAPADPEQCKAEFLPCCDFLANCNSAAAMECILQDV